MKITDAHKAIKVLQEERGFFEALANNLMIEADGGDSPVDFLIEAMKDAVIDAPYFMSTALARQRIKHTIKCVKLKDEANN